MSATQRHESGARERRCSRCDAPIRAGSQRCWLCGAAVDRNETKPAAASASVYPSSAAERRGQFSLASLMMLVTLVCVALGVSTIAMGIGIPLGLILLVVWLPTAIWALPRKARPKASTVLGTIGAVMLTIGVVAVVAAVAVLILVFSFLSAILELCAALAGA